MIYVEPFPPTGERLSITRADDVGHHVMWSSPEFTSLIAVNRPRSPPVR